MAEPSNNVQPQLLPHVHLLVSWQQPYQPQPLSAERALALLLQAPQIVRDKPVSWQYLHTPSDGTLLLAWQPLSRLGETYATDGYVWSGQEHRFPTNIANCTLQVFVAESGFIPGNEHFTVHRRTRYRVISSPNGGHDPALELVHYTAAFQEHQNPTSSVRPSPQIQQQLSERKYLEKQGSLARRDFMLHDKMNYPQVNVPQNPLPGNPYQPHASMYGRGSMPRPQPGAPAMRVPGTGPSPNKRPQPGPPRLAGGAANPFAGAQQMPDFLQDEDNHIYGDALDFLTPREISSARYKQHHEWMEEVLSSPYALSQIMPVNLGLKVDGQLGELTEGLWTDGKQEESREEARVKGEAGLNKENIGEFEKRVQGFVEKGEDELAAMKQAHQAKMVDMSQQKLFAKLERRLAETSGSEGLDEAVIEAEAATGLKISPREDVVQVNRGGILDKVEEPEYIVEPPQVQDFPDFGDMDTAGEALDFFDSNMDYSNA